jgi:hypothetical protein
MVTKGINKNVVKEEGEVVEGAEEEEEGQVEVAEEEGEAGVVEMDNVRVMVEEGTVTGERCSNKKLDRNFPNGPCSMKQLG